MSLNLYDRALYDKIYELFPNVINSADSSALEEGTTNEVKVKEDISKKTKPKLALPLISFWRTDNPPNMQGSNEGNYPSIIKGRNHMIGDLNGFKIRTFPIKITYQVTIWSDKRVEVDEIYKEFLMIFCVEEPYLRVRAVESDFYNDETGSKELVVVDEEFSLVLEDSTSDTDITSFPDKGRMYRQDIILTIDNAKLFYLGNSIKVAKNIPIREGLL